MSDNEISLVQLLTEQGQAKPEDSLYELCNTISNIVSSYDDPYDAFAELVQNALDAVAARYDLVDFESYVPEVHVKVNIAECTLTVIDNGTGIPWEYRQWAVKPNYSLKRRLGQRGARGEKGAALAFLQFGHANFSIETKTSGDAWRYSLNDGKSWFMETSSLLDDNRSYDEKVDDFPEAVFSLSQIDGNVMGVSGTTAQVTFSDDRLERLLGTNNFFAKKRLDYILLTRTGIGFYVHRDDKDKLAPWQKDLIVKVTLEGAGSGVESWELETGFLYPHTMAKRSGSRKTSFLTSNTKNNEILYDFFDEDWIKQYLEKIAKNKKHIETIKRFELRGYVAYAHNNSWYEQISSDQLDLPAEIDSSAVADGLIQVNGGFLLAVRDFPTGRRKSFLHRSGAEHKSRTFVLLNFGGDYKPDYGRKNLGAEAHTLVLDLCKELLVFASSKREFLLRGKEQARHSATSVADAQQSLKDDANSLKSRGVFIKSGDSELSRGPATETEVIAEFVRLVSSNVLPGFSIYGFLSAGMLDGYFDYKLEKSETVSFDSVNKPLGQSFSQGRPKVYKDQWMEFKVHSDSFTDDLKKDPGESAKKYFSTVDLLVCESVDTATDDYELVSVNEENFEERRFYGVTHLLEFSGNRDHKVQVICLKTLRDILAKSGEIQSIRSVEPLEG